MCAVLSIEWIKDRDKISSFAFQMIVISMQYLYTLNVTAIVGR